MNEQTPALNRLLSSNPIVPSECSDCPFGELDDDQNFADPSEAYYQCNLLRIRVWGEEPKCNLNHWQARARQEVRDVIYKMRSHL